MSLVIDVSGQTFHEVDVYVGDVNGAEVIMTIEAETNKSIRHNLQLEYMTKVLDLVNSKEIVRIGRPTIEGELNNLELVQKALNISIDLSIKMGKSKICLMPYLNHMSRTADKSFDKPFIDYATDLGFKYVDGMFESAYFVLDLERFNTKELTVPQYSLEFVEGI